MSNGIADLRRYRHGGPHPPGFTREDEGVGASHLAGYDDVSPRRQANWESERTLRPGGGPFAGRWMGPTMLNQWALDIAGEQIRRRGGRGKSEEFLDKVGNLVGARDITAGDLTPKELDAVKRAAIRAILQQQTRAGRDPAQIELDKKYGEGNRYGVQYEDWLFNVNDDKYRTNRIMKKLLPYEINYDHEDWNKHPSINANASSEVRKKQIDGVITMHEGYGSVAKPNSPIWTKAAAGTGPGVTQTGAVTKHLGADWNERLRGWGSMVPRFTDPSAAMQLTIGRAAIRREGDNWYLEDRYNWNDAEKHMNRLKAAAVKHFGEDNMDAWTGAFDKDIPAHRKMYDEDMAGAKTKYAKARVQSKYFGSMSGDKGDGQQAEGSRVRINLGDLDSLIDPDNPDRYRLAPRDESAPSRYRELVGGPPGSSFQDHSTRLAGILEDLEDQRQAKLAGDGGPMQLARADEPQELEDEIRRRTAPDWYHAMYRQPGEEGGDDGGGFFRQGWEKLAGLPFLDGDDEADLASADRTRDDLAAEEAAELTADAAAAVNAAELEELMTRAGSYEDHTAHLIGVDPAVYDPIWDR